MLFLSVLFLLSVCAYIAFPIYADQVESIIFQTFLKKDEKRLNKILSHSSNKYGNKDNGHIEDFL